MTNGPVQQQQQQQPNNQTNGPTIREVSAKPSRSTTNSPVTTTNNNKNESKQSKASPIRKPSTPATSNNNTSGNGGGGTTPSTPVHQQPHTTSQQMENFLRIKEIVKKAIAAKHTFMIHGRAKVVRECLLARGWCEKFHKKSPQINGELQLSVDSSPTALLAGVGNLNDKANERVLISRMLGNHTINFLWNSGSEWTGWPSQENKSTIFNRYTRANFTSKVGLCSNVRQMHWYYEAGIANTLFPRCYNISQPDQMHAFIEDFRLTACLSLLKWLVDEVKIGGEDSVRATNGIVPLRALDFAIGRCSDFIGSKSHEDIDHELERIWSHQWEQFVGWYYKLVHGHAQLVANNMPLNKYLLAARHLLKKVKNYWPQLEMDGTQNVWILKPGNKSRGRGIVLLNKLDDIIARVSPSNKSTDTRFVIQKYIERPLLIYDTKFDIRQWFIVTNAQPLTLWMYKQSYLRFCSQKFSLSDFHESIHLSNNAVQCKYKNSPDRDAALPSDNMWDHITFKEFLRARGNGDVWDELIYPGMKQGLVGSLLASQEAMDRRKNSFELYGADFMVMEDFSVWLIEINSHPDMSSSTSVTTRLCRKAIEDTVKVVVDYRENQSADTGDFELVYKQKISGGQGYLGAGLALHGTRIDVTDTKRPSNSGPAVSLPWTRRRSSGGSSTTGATNQQQAPDSNSGATSSTGANNTITGSNAGGAPKVGPVLVDLIEELEQQLDREFFEYLKLRSSNGLTRQTLPLDVRIGAGEPQPQPNRLPQVCANVETNTDANYFAVPLTLQDQSGDQQQHTVSVNGTNGVQKKTKDKLSRVGGKNSPVKRNVRHKINVSRMRNMEIPATPRMAKKLMSKIIDLQKETLENAAESSSHLAKLFNPPSLPEYSVSSSGLSGTNETSSKVSKKSQAVTSTKATPAISNATVPTSKVKKLKKPPALDDDKLFQKVKQNRSKSQVIVNVTDMYAVGQAMNK
ncbi:hypothetical protein QAD02_019418 [Eretmocerus hayati]|uniref:Uncharacterized protein n=1 Tax=Eretmocerus hayati TaxID=131215 RepID=A0ACC2PKQ7_9HYME|nr:hypothetical protein QAD02_019418 [Eretmocerus hayati]